MNLQLNLKSYNNSIESSTIKLRSLNKFIFKSKDPSYMQKHLKEILKRNKEVKKRKKRSIIATVLVKCLVKTKLEKHIITYTHLNNYLRAHTMIIYIYV